MAKQVNPKKWCQLFIATVIGFTLSIVLVDYKIDLYGLFSYSPGRSHSIYSNERMGKYLFGYRYIPQNFDGILIGSSISDNWNTRSIKDVRIYNASISGGNISEEKLIADKAFASGRMKLALFCIHPYLTANHGLKSGYMNPREYWGGLGSIQLFHEYFALFLTKAGWGKIENDESGTADLEPSKEVVAKLQAGLRAISSQIGPPAPILVDEVAYSEYGRVLEEARASGARVIGFIPPLWSDSYAMSRPALAHYQDRMFGLFRPNEKIIDFNNGRYASHEADRTNFFDGIHMTRMAAEYFSEKLAEEIGPIQSSRHVALSKDSPR